MVQYLTLFPLYLIILTLVVIVIPAIAVIYLRLTLYKNLTRSIKKVKRLVTDNQSVGTKPTIIETLENRYRRANSQLENVNTAALIDQCYGQETLTFFNLQFSYDEWDYFCRLFPNLLLSFGLLGTFLGITLNLANLSQIINKLDPNDFSALTSQLETPLQSMGIAFITSLIALIFSSILAVVNLFLNTSVAKSQLISSIEDYLDNIFQIEIDGHSRLDQAVDRMVQQQQEFLSRFHEKVGEVMENSLGKASDRLVEQNTKSHLLAEQVYQRFLESAGTISGAADSFQESMLTLKTFTPELVIASQLFTQSVAIFQTSAEHIERSKFSENLGSLTRDLAKTQTQFAASTQILTDNITLIAKQNKQATDLARAVYTQLLNSAKKITNATNNLLQIAPELTSASQQFNQSASILHDSATIIERSKFSENVETLTANLMTNQMQFAQSTKELAKNITAIGTDNQRVCTQLLLSSETINKAGNNLLQIAPELTSASQQFNQSASMLYDSATIIERSKFSENVETLTANLMTTQIQFAQSTKELAKNITTIGTDNQRVCTQLLLSSETINKAGNNLLQIAPELTSASQQFNQSASIVYDSATIIERSKFSENLETLTANLMTNQMQFAQSTKELAKNITTIGTDNQRVCTQLLLSSETINKAGNNLLQITPELTSASQQFNQSVTLFQSLTEKIKLNKI